MKPALAKKITDLINIPTIGIGAGKHCDGQVLVIDDILGLYNSFTPKFVKKYCNLSEIINKSVKSYAKEVRTSKFPSKKYTY